VGEFKEEDKLPDAKGAKVAQKTQKIPKQGIPKTVFDELVVTIIFVFLFCVFCATFAPFASGCSYF
jgi:hypothetical protein